MRDKSKVLWVSIAGLTIVGAVLIAIAFFTGGSSWIADTFSFSKWLG